MMRFPWLAAPAFVAACSLFGGAGDLTSGPGSAGAAGAAGADASTDGGGSAGTSGAGGSSGSSAGDSGATDACATTPADYYLDEDDDGYGAGEPIEYCVAPEGWVTQAGDCDDTDRLRHPGALEECNGVDDDCDEQVDEPETVYKDNDGDGFAASNAPTMETCGVPTGWALPQDVDGDGEFDWDCEDADIGVFPGNLETCGNGKDDDCDGVPDRVCFTKCPEATWPYAHPGVGVGTRVQLVDLDGDRQFETIFQDTSSFVVVDSKGVPVFEETVPTLNFARGTVVLADIDDYDSFGAPIQDLEILSGNGKVPAFYFRSGGTLTKVESTVEVYDRSEYLVRDLDRDGVAEFFATSNCIKTIGPRIFRFDRAGNAIVHVADIAEPDGVCEYWDGRTLTDLDGDGTLELVFGNGHGSNAGNYSGKFYAHRFDDLVTLTTSDACPGCFDTTIPGETAMAGIIVFRFLNELRAQATFLGTPATEFNSFAFSLDGQRIGSPTTANPYFGTIDHDDDGVAETDSVGNYLTVGRFDVDGDGWPDRIFTTTNAQGIGELVVALYDPATMTTIDYEPSRLAFGNDEIFIGGVWDIDDDGRLEVITYDQLDKLYCHELGPSTWDRDHSIPPRFGPHLKDNQWDPYEPNEGTDTTGDGVPDQVTQIASAMSASGSFHAYLSSATDRDYYLVNTSLTSNVCLTAPAGRVYDLEIYSFAPSANPDGLIWSDTSMNRTKCFQSSDTTPPRSNEFRFVVGVVPHAGLPPEQTFTAFRPYWLDIPK